MKIVLLKERPMSWNKLYAGIHWSKRVEEVQRVHFLVKCSTLKVKNRFKNKVNIIVTAYFDHSPFDSDNIPAKLYVDGLRERVLENDNHTYVHKVTTLSEIDTSNPRVEIDIEEV